MGLFDHFPYTNVHELNLDWVLSMMKALEAEWEAFTAGNSLTFADPLQHDISKTYAKNTIVLDANGNAYVSLQPVPVGVALSNQDYWLMVFDYEAFIEKVNKNFTARYYRGQYRATAAMVIGDWLTVDDVLCKATANIAVDDVLEVGVNIEHFTLEDFIKAFMQSANQLIQQYKNDIDASEVAYRQQLANDIANTTASLQAQLDAAISGATVDSEVINARVGYDSTTYPTLGDAIRTQVGDIHNILDDISDISMNIWDRDYDYTFTNYMVLSDIDFLPAGSYWMEAEVTTDAPSTTCRVEFRDASNNLIVYITIPNNGDRQLRAVNLTSECKSITMFSASSSSTSPGYTATYNNIQISTERTLVFVPHFTARDTNAEGRISTLEGYFIKGKTTPLNYLPDTIPIGSLNFISNNENLVDFYDVRNEDGYLNGEIVTPSASYKTSWFIKVEPSETYYFGGYSLGARFINEYDEELNYISTASNVDNLTVSSDTHYVRFTWSSTASYNDVFCSKTAIPAGHAPLYNPIIPAKYLELPAVLSNKNKYSSVSKNLAVNEYMYNTNMANSIRSNDRIVFNADITSFNGIEIGFAWYNTSYKYNKFVIDSTNLTIYDYSGNTEVVAHGLTITNNIQVIIEGDFLRRAKVTIISNGEQFEKTNCALDRRRVCFLYAQSINSVLPNAKLTWSCTDFNKPVWIFGDSYEAGYTNRWPKYAYINGYDKNCLWDAFPGEKSEQSIESLENLLQFATPQTIVWCLGMNDGSDDDASTPNSDWLTVQTRLRTLCSNYGINLVLATVPSVPSVYNEAKNANIRNSGYRYIDFAVAVGAQSDGTWFTGMLSSDNVHPSDEGAKALYGRAVLDLPELMIDN